MSITTTYMLLLHPCLLYTCCFSHPLGLISVRACVFVYDMRSQCCYIIMWLTQLLNHFLVNLDWDINAFVSFNPHKSRLNPLVIVLGGKSLMFIMSSSSFSTPFRDRSSSYSSTRSVVVDCQRPLGEDTLHSLLVFAIHTRVYLSRSSLLWQSRCDVRFLF